MDKSAAQKQNLPQSRELEEGTGGAGSKGLFRYVGVALGLMSFVLGVQS